MNKVEPGLFGLNKTNRDFTLRETWGKNQFNSSFSASLCCFLESKNLPANYLAISSRKFSQNFISIKDVLESMLIILMHTLLLNLNILPTKSLLLVHYQEQI
jgi:hypothetical protein